MYPIQYNFAINVVFIIKDNVTRILTYQPALPLKLNRHVGLATAFTTVQLKL